MSAGVEGKAMENVAESTGLGRRAETNGGDAGKNSEWRNLVSDVEDLVKKIANVDDAEISRIRGKVEDTLARAKSVAGEGTAALRARAGEASEVTDKYVHDNPWAAIGIAAAIGIVIGFVASRR
jgi:ElaB/YqjD/DUF883 family membrane-anchored ribosome-binding protein